MLIDLIRLKNNIEKIIKIDRTYSFDKEYLTGTDLLELNDVKVVGEITKNSLNDINIHLNISGTMVLPCAITLKPVDYNFNVELESTLNQILQEEPEKIKKDENTLDILPIIWENILMEIPMRVVSKDADRANLKGDGWQFVTELKPSTNKELEKLKDLL